MTDDYETERDEMVDELVRRGSVERSATEAAMRAVPRHEFVPENQRSRAYDDRPLPIGERQTVSAPHMVAIMTDLLAPDRGDRLLEIGTGCGYHAAVTAEMVGPGRLYSVEYEEALAEDARERLGRLGYDVAIRTGNGREGWAEHAPFDGAYLTCAPESVPDAVVEQVRPGGRIVAPVGSERQQLVCLTRRADGGVECDHHGGVRFVPMRGGDEDEE